ncbi:hypothetical protein PAPYR_3913 [Paratrimastix pyriformis]|uniref:Uncharacterized protein n=1 Tax=Paratrimastix pyriformis TaxID=342808 RepID=A0ABQ8UN20_9EUKA|nr:hypothetical protein PAPYR_3913 [Paratrimastix pyriformis]
MPENWLFYKDFRFHFSLGDRCPELTLCRNRAPCPFDRCCSAWDSPLPCAHLRACGRFDSQIGVQPSKDNSSTASGISFGCFLAGSARVRPCRHFRPPPGRPQVPVPMRQPLEGVDPRSQCAFLFDAHVPQKLKSVKFARKVLLNGIKC